MESNYVRINEYHEKPRIMKHFLGKIWGESYNYVCKSDNFYAGFGKTPEEAYKDYIEFNSLKPNGI